jgi:hypothetical protein
MEQAKMFNRRYHWPVVISLLTLIMLAACTAENSDFATATSLPESNAIIGITPVPLPTTVPNQTELLQAAFKQAKNHTGVTMDFVIDLQEFNDGQVPFQLDHGDNWYKYTGTDHAFSVLLHSSLAPVESRYNHTTEDGIAIKSGRVRAEFSVGEYATVSWETVASTDSTRFFDSEHYLATYDFTPFLEGGIDAKILSDDRIELNDFPGREVFIESNLSHGMTRVFGYARVRIYVINNTAYQLTLGGIGRSLPESEARFFNSFTPYPTIQ